MIRAARFIGGVFGSAIRTIIVGVVAVAMIAGGVAIADYNMTAGSGLVFASQVISAANYAAMLVCDATVGKTQCAAVNSFGSQQIDVTTSNNNLYAALTSAVPYLNATAWNTNTYTTGQTNPGNADVHGAEWVDVGAWAGTGLGAPSNFGTSPGAVAVPGVNASQFQGTAAVVAEPCQTNTKLFAPINLSGTSGLYTTPVLAGTAAKKTYVCQFIANNNAAVNVAFFEATNGGSCGSGQAALWGGTTAATGFQFAANGGVSLGNGGYAIMATATNQDDICAITSANTQITGTIVYVKQ
jgi:hypothetical protein